MISVVVPSYNHGDALPGLLDSLRAQHDQDFEVIIVDDGSSDGTTGIVERYVSHHPEEARRVHYVAGEHHGAPAARNKGAALARGPYLLFADADLILYPAMLSRLRAALEGHPEAAYAYSSFRFGWKLFQSRPLDAAALGRENYIHTSALIRRDAFSGFDETLVRFQDWDLWLTLLDRGAVGVFVPDVLFRARITRAGISRWRPRVWYAFWRAVVRLIGYAPRSFRAYEEARRVVLAKHGL